MGKNGRFGKDYGKVVGKESSSRPGWKGPSYVKKKSNPPKEKPTKDEDDDLPQPSVPLELQQLLLNIFKDSFPEVLASENRQHLMQDVKNALYERDFSRAFGRQDYLETYSIRWSPTRALCYQSILVDVSEHLVELYPLCRVLQSGTEVGSANAKGSIKSALHVVCFGGGAAEVVALGGFLRFLQDASSTVEVTSNDVNLSGGMTKLSVSDEVEQTTSPSCGNSEVESPTESTTARPQAPGIINGLRVALVDSAKWGEVVHKLRGSIVTPPPLSKYASVTAKAANVPLVSANDIRIEYLAEDVLGMDSSRMSNLVGKTPILLTLLFTLNELYTLSISSTTKFLLDLTIAAKSGSLLLVVDSPGSYSETVVGGSSKKYPMHFLLDHTLLDTSKTDDKAMWEKLVSDDSRWFRLSEDLRYPVSLENMRYQIHLYRRL